MVNYKLYVDKSTSFECRIKLEGASLKNAQARLIVQSEDVNLLYEGKIEKSGKCTIPIDKLRGVLDEDVKGTLKLEVIADDTYFQPWSSPFIVSASKKLRVEIVSQKIKKTSLQVEVRNPEVKKVQRLATVIARTLRNRGITAETVIKKRSVVKKCIREHTRRTTDIDIHLLITSVVKKLAK